MASISELYRTGYVLDRIEGELAENEPRDTTLHLRKLPFLKFARFGLVDNGDKVIRRDLEEFLGDRLYGAEFPVERELVFGNGELKAIISTRLRGTKRFVTCAEVVASEGLTVLMITLPKESDILYPRVGIPPEVQRVALLNDYSQLFRYTEQGIRGRTPYL